MLAPAPAAQFMQSVELTLINTPHHPAKRVRCVPGMFDSLGVKVP